MPKYDDIEHDGTEDFNLFQNKKTHHKIKEKVSREIESKKEEKLEQAQQKWLDLENPFLWEGEI
jgi:hypothetical protein